MHCDPRQLPFAANSIDLVVMPHVLEFYDDPHQILREVERILIPEGQIVLTGFNLIPVGLRRRLRRGPAACPLAAWDNISPQRAARTGCSCSASRLRGRCSAACTALPYPEMAASLVLAGIVRRARRAGQRWRSPAACDRAAACG